MTKTAVVYVRVSTKEQAERAGDPEGYSIPAQRQACHKKAAALGATVLDEYVDRGESARSADRPALKAMLRRIKEGGVDYVVVHKVDRLARNRADDVTIGLALKAAGVQLVSCTENIDDTPSGKLLHGVMASIAEFYSANLANEVIKGSVQKAQDGGTPYQAPIGYLNVRRRDDGRDEATIVVDPERSHLVRYAYEAYATGDYTLRELLDELTDLGLTNRPSGTRPARPLHLSRLAKLLHDPYYIGVVSYRGQQYAGRHEPIVDDETFEQVQALLRARKLSGERQRKHDHYLKGTIYCARCGSRLSVTVAVGNGGRYPYFFCLGRQRRNGCTLPSLPIDEVEAVVERHYRTEVRLDPQAVETIRGGLTDDLRTMEKYGDQEVQRQRRLVERIQRERRAWADKVFTGSVPDDIGREKQNELAVQLVKSQHLPVAARGSGRRCR